MKVNADIYFLHSASFQSHIRELNVSLTHETEALLHNIRVVAIESTFEPMKWATDVARIAGS